MKTSEKVKQLLEKGILISPDIMNDDAALDQLLAEASSDDTSAPVMSLKVMNIQKEVGKEQDFKKPTEQEDDAPVDVIFSYAEPSKKRTFQDFVSLFNARFKTISNILRQRTELRGVMSINRVLAKKEKESVAIVGMVYEKTITKNDNVILKLEDPTGMVSVLIHKNRADIYTLAKEICLDEIVGVVGTYENIVYANNLFIPDVPLSHELKKGPEEEYAVFLADPQVGNKHFLEKSFLKFLYWINGRAGNDEQKRIARKIKYLIIPGDLVEGVGVFPGQEDKLSIKDIKEQYNQFAAYLKQIPPHIKIVLQPGNHDAGRLAEPQPALYKDYAAALWELPNVTMVSNPSMINIGKKKDFEGFNILMYHGGSIIYYAQNIDTIRSQGGLKRPELVMKYLLQRRHLAPTHSSTLYIPDSQLDPLTITKLPDIFVTGHIHRAVAMNYRNITMINASAWDLDEEYYTRRGLEPQPGRVFVVNLQTRAIKIMNFFSKPEVAT